MRILLREWIAGIVVIFIGHQSEVTIIAGLPDAESARSSTTAVAQAAVDLGHPEIAGIVENVGEALTAVSDSEYPEYDVITDSDENTGE